MKYNLVDTNSDSIDTPDIFLARKSPQNLNVDRLGLLGDDLGTKSFCSYNCACLHQHNYDTLLKSEDYLSSDTNVLENSAAEGLSPESLDDRSSLGIAKNTSPFSANSLGNTEKKSNSSDSLPSFTEILAEVEKIIENAKPQKRAVKKSDFEIEIEFGKGTTFFTKEMKAAVESAADTWEDAISRSNFIGGHTLSIEVEGEIAPNSGFLAAAGPDKFIYDADRNILPSKGTSIVNTSLSKMRQFTANPDFFETVMTHEFGHVMGIGSLWEANNLIDPLTGNYRAFTKASAVYNEGRKGAFANARSIPLTQGERKGSDGGHWDEKTFGNELMTSTAETPGISHPLSEMTLASLEDIGWQVDYRVADVFPNVQTPFT